MHPRVFPPGSFFLLALTFLSPKCPRSKLCLKGSLNTVQSRINVHILLPPNVSSSRGGDQVTLPGKLGPMLGNNARSAGGRGGGGWDYAQGADQHPTPGMFEKWKNKLRKPPGFCQISRPLLGPIEGCLQRRHSLILFNLPIGFGGSGRDDCPVPASHWCRQVKGGPPASFSPVTKRNVLEILQACFGSPDSRKTISRSPI